MEPHHSDRGSAFATTHWSVSLASGGGSGPRDLHERGIIRRAIRVYGGARARKDRPIPGLPVREFLERLPRVITGRQGRARAGTGLTTAATWPFERPWRLPPRPDKLLG